MSYTPNPYDAAQPTEDKFVVTAAAEFRALKALVASLLPGASYAGAWSALTGPLAAGMLVAHVNTVWLLLTSLADVTTSEPGVSADWVDISGVKRSGDTMTGPLSVPAGASGAEVPQAQETALLATTQFDSRNRFVNPGFTVWQEGTTFTSAAASAIYCADQWQMADAGANLTVTRAFQDTDPCIQKAGAAGHTAGWIRQPLESFGVRDIVGPSGSKAVTISIDVICSAAQSGHIELWRAGSEDNFTSPVLIASVPWAHAGGGARERKVATFVDLPVEAANGLLVYVTHTAIAAGQTIRFARAQFEDGVRATRFAYRPPGLEQDLCERYFQIYTSLETLKSGEYFAYPLRTTMRATPGVIFIEGGASVGVAHVDRYSFALLYSGAVGSRFMAIKFLSRLI